MVINYHGPDIKASMSGLEWRMFAAITKSFQFFSFVAIRIRGPIFTDEAEGRGLRAMQSVVDVFSCSYGPADNGWKMGDMGPMAQGAVQYGVKNVSWYWTGNC